MRKLLIAVCVLLLCGNAATAQLLPPLQPEQDACNALQLCTGYFFTPYSYQGYGTKREMSQFAGACMDETNSVWFYLKVGTPGTIVFTITPVNTSNDYDFAIWNITHSDCNSITSTNWIRCESVDNPHSPGGLTGLSTTATTVREGPGAGLPYVSAINAAAGDEYLLIVDNFIFGSALAGFGIDFSGSTATFTGNGNPSLDSIAFSCDYSQGMKIHIDQNIQCNTIAADGSDFTLSPPLATVTSATGINCTSGGYTKDITLTFSNPLPVGNYILKAKTGNDGNTLINICNNPLLLPDSLNFSIWAKPIAPDTTTCVNNPITLDMQTGAPPGASYTTKWSPASFLNDPSLDNPLCSPYADITYIITITPTDKPGCVRKDTMSVTVLTGYDLANNDTTICKGDIVSMNVTGDNHYTYTWSPTTFLSDPNISNPISTPDTTIRYTVTATYPGCIDSVQTINITVEPLPAVTLGNDTTVCYGDTLRMHPVIVPAFAGYQYNWTPASAFDDPAGGQPLFHGTATATVRLTVTTPIGCKGADSLVYTVVPVNFISVSNDTFICPHDSVQLHVSGGSSYRWASIDSIINPNSDHILVKPVRTTTYTVYGLDTNKCGDSAFVTVDILPQAILTLPDSITIFQGESYHLQPATNCLYINWFPSIGLNATNISNPVAMPEADTRYFAVGSTEVGCIAVDSVDILVSDGVFVDVPNAFAPGSGANNVLYALRRGHVVLKNFAVFDRWGKKVFETNDFNTGWDGTLNGTQQPMGVYVYTVSAMAANGRIINKQGNVTLLR